MDAYKKGIWVKNSTTDSQLFQGLRGYNAVVHRKRRPDEGTPPSQPAIPRPDVMTSLENIPSSLEDYLRSFNSADDQQHNLALPNFSSSDEFLYGVISGNFGGTSLPQPRPRGQDYQAAGDSPMGLNPSIGQLQDPSLFPASQTIPSDLSTSSPHSDEATSSGGPAVANHPPPLVDHIFPPTFGPSMILGEETQATALWDKFLRELGV
jgi:hypothetical protein